MQNTCLYETSHPVQAGVFVLCLLICIRKVTFITATLIKYKKFCDYNRKTSETYVFLRIYSEFLLYHFG